HDINIENAINVIGFWLDSLDLPEDYPLGTAKDAMVLVMKNNRLEWKDMYFLQLLGAAMGTSVACMWAAIFMSSTKWDC
ncbi:hypothetical protein ACHAWF_000638, partial [Thalassiosira exigua]